YLFSAKELDETGLYYFGARYYNPKFSIWQSTDPALERFFRGGAAVPPRNAGLYTYAWNNPVIISDPKGEDPVCSASQCPSVEDQAAREDALKKRMPYIRARQKYLDERVTAVVGGVEYYSITRRELFEKQ